MKPTFRNNNVSGCLLNFTITSGKNVQKTQTNLFTFEKKKTLERSIIAAVVLIQKYSFDYTLVNTAL